MTERHYREVAESLLGSGPNAHYSRNLSHSQSINLVSEELVSGHRPQGRMSSVRRFFCLLVTFDILFTSLMWLICNVMKGETLEQIFNREILHYNIKISLFDIVMVAVTRFTLLLLFYALLYINNWSVIALTTGGTCAFLIAKVFVFDWPNAAQPVFQVFLILASFTLSWSEAWFLDFRVLPHEMQAKQLLDAIVHHSGAVSTERTPLLHPGRPPGVGSTLGESTVNWFSPVETPEHSPRPKRQPQDVILTQEQIDEYKRLAEESLSNAWRVINQQGWRVEKKGSTRGDVVESRVADHFGKVYRFTGIVECPPQFLYEEFKTNITRLPDWNPTILKSEIIKEISDGIDLSYQVTAGGGKGLIAPRDFVILRHAAPLGKDGRVTQTDPHCYISSGVSVTVPGYPPHRDMVRGHNKVGCWLLKPKTVQLQGGKIEQHTVFQWLMCCDLNGKIPQFILDAAFATVMLDYIVHVRKHVQQARSKGMF